MDQSASTTARTILSPIERRVLGVLVEKQKTTPDAYPMTLAALTTGSNQKSNRDPVTSYDGDELEQALQDLKSKGAVIRVEGSGRVEKWKHNLYEWLDLRSRPVEMAVLAELLLRGAQTEGDLRGRASRMDPIPDLEALGKVLGLLKERELIVYITPPGQKRGVVLTHNFYSNYELDTIRQQFAGRILAGAEDEPSAAPSARASLAQEVALLRDRLERAESELVRLSEQVESLRKAVGA
jgi:uncharacterized protein